VVALRKGQVLSELFEACNKQGRRVGNLNGILQANGGLNYEKIDMPLQLMLTMLETINCGVFLSESKYWIGRRVALECVILKRFWHFRCPPLIYKRILSIFSKKLKSS